MSEWYRLPERASDGNWKLTKDPDQYGNAWSELGDKVAAFFPGFKAMGFDPDIVFQKWEKNRWGQSVCVDRFELSVSACRSLLETAQLKEKKP